MKRQFLLILTAGLLLLSGCTALQQAIAFKDCKYSYKSLTDITFMDLPTSQLLTFGGAAKMANGLLGKEAAPLGFTIHLNVDNPNQFAAAVDSLYYIVSLDSVEVAEGSMPENFRVEPGERADLALPLKVDMRNIMKSDKRSIMTKTIKNMVGIGSEPVQVLVRIRPTLRVGNRKMTVPAYIPVSFEYTGKKKN